jgi:NADH:ubiquinone oxidoreductase subunit C
MAQARIGVALVTRQMTGQELAAAAERLIPGSVDRSTDVTCYLKHETLVETMTALRDDAETDLVHLTNLCAADYWDHFEVVYHIQSFYKNQIATIKVDVACTRLQM